MHPYWEGRPRAGVLPPEVVERRAAGALIGPGVEGTNRASVKTAACVAHGAIARMCAANLSPGVAADGQLGL